MAVISLVKGRGRTSFEWRVIINTWHMDNTDVCLFSHWKLWLLWNKMCRFNSTETNTCKNTQSQRRSLYILLFLCFWFADPVCWQIIQKTHRSTGVGTSCRTQRLKQLSDKLNRKAKDPARLHVNEGDTDERESYRNE